VGVTGVEKGDTGAITTVLELRRTYHNRRAAAVVWVRSIRQITQRLRWCSTMCKTGVGWIHKRRSQREIVVRQL